MQARMPVSYTGVRGSNAFLQLLTPSDDSSSWVLATHMGNSAGVSDS